ncbi:MAG: NAD(P) transhydrogenase, partial [Colwellia sp.]
MATKNKAKTTTKVIDNYDYDAIIIGTGPGGEGTAMELSKREKSVAIVERYKDVGGGCTHWGTIPSKALRQSVSRLIEYNASPLFRGTEKAKHLTFPDILKHASSVIRKQVQLRSGFYDRNRVQLVAGEASFIDANTLKIVKDDGSVEQITAKQIVIATGSHPYRPDDIDFNHPRVYDSDTILSLKHDPRSIIIYGAGVIGSEYASIFRGLGVKVDLINTRDRLLSFLDAEMSDSLSYHLWNNGVVIRHGEAIERVEASDDSVVVHLESGKKMRADCLLFANGRTGNTTDLNVENAGLKADGRG